MLIPFVGGASAGLIHVLSGPDHLAAIAPLASDGRRRFWTTGALWGLGHSSGVFTVGLLALLFRSWLPIDALSSWSERLVGVVLIGIGLWGLRRALRQPALAAQVHSHAHSHGGITHAHPHVHAQPRTHAEGSHGHTGPAQTDAGAAHRHSGATHAQARPAHVHEATDHTHTHTAFAVGILHGLAGSSHFLGVLPALGLPDFSSSVSYLAGYGAGTVAGMALFASAMGLLASRAHDHGPNATRWLLSACSATAVLVGTAWLAL
jgi:ABC-type nickel/cobalt efflux system permease component RcnA